MTAGLQSGSTSTGTVRPGSLKSPAATEASVATIRRDLNRLEQAGLILRTHGSARIADAATTEVAFRIRETQNIAAKRAIAATTAPLIRPNSSVFLDAGTTVLQFARHLRLNPMPLTTFTNGLMVAIELLNLPGVNVTVIGGQMRDEDVLLDGTLRGSMLDSSGSITLLLGAARFRTTAASTPMMSARRG